MDVIKKINLLFQKHPAEMKGLNIPSEKAGMMLEMLLQTQDKELTCDEVHDLLAQYTELAMQGEDVANLLPFVHHHLAMCPDCREEYEALIRILHAQGPLI